MLVFTSERQVLWAIVVRYNNIFFVFLFRNLLVFYLN